MSEVLYEQYKDALRRGHVAALRGRLDAAAAAYREAAGSRPTGPCRTSGSAASWPGSGRTDEALAAYAAALDRAPADEGAMRGRADVLAAAGPARRGRRHARPAGRDPRARRPPGRRLRRGPASARAGRVARPAPPGREPRRPAARDAGRRGRGARRSRARWACSRRSPALDAERRGRRRRRRATDRREADHGRAADAVRPDPAVLTLAVEEALEAGDLDEARRRALVAAAGHRAVGQFHAAMDACYQALAIAAVRPGHPPRCSPSCTSTAAGAARRPTSSSCSAGSSSSTGDGADPGAAVLRSPPPASPTTRGSPPSAPDRVDAAERCAGRCPGHSGDRSAMLHSASDAQLLGSILDQVQPDDARRHRDHGAPHLLAVQPDPRDARGPPGHRRQRPRRSSTRWRSRSTCAC